MDNRLIIGLFFLIYIPIWLCGVINGILLRRFFSKHYPDLAEAIFYPASKSAFAAAWDRMKYMISKGYLATGDQAFIARVDRYRRIEIFFITAILLCMAASLVLILALDLHA